MRWIAVSLGALALAGCAGGEDDQLPEAQAPPQPTPPREQTPPRAQTPSQSWTPSPAHSLPLEPPLGSRSLPNFGLTGPPTARLVAASVVGHTVRYVFKTDTPARSLKREMTTFLLHFAFGEKGRSMVVRLLDGRGRFAWAAGYDGVSKTWVRARSNLARCASIFYFSHPSGPDPRLRRLPPAREASEAPPCRLERRPNEAVTVLR